jgi:hypothetical protein
MDSTLKGIEIVTPKNKYTIFITKFWFLWVPLRTKKSYPLDVNQCPHQTTQYKFMMHYVKSGDKRRRGQLEHLAQKNAGTKSKHLRILPVKQY